MNETARPLGGRLPLADPAALAPAQRELYDQLISSWVVFTDKLGIRSTTRDGRLIGPFNALLLHPEVTAKLLEFQAAESANTGLTPTVREVVIIVLGSVYGADYELYAHEIVGRAVGLAEDQVAALVGGDIRRTSASTRSSRHGSRARWRRVTTSTRSCTGRRSRPSGRRACSTSPR
jgi:4-carboxymuconolactone decarboxylase